MCHGWRPQSKRGRYAGIDAAEVAAAMLALCHAEGEGVHRHHNTAIRRLALTGG